MSAIAEPANLPMVFDSDGVARIGGTRVTLDTLAEAYESDLDASAIVEQYPALLLSDVELILGYLREHPEDLRSYLEERSRVREVVRRENEARHTPDGVKDRLLARRVNSQ